MALRSLRQTYDRMVNEKLVSGTPNNDWKDLSTLKARIDTMYRYRNDAIRDNDTVSRPADNTPGKVQNVCRQHNYTSFKQFQQKTGVDYSMSIGDLNDALDAMAFCTCNSRMIQECNCVSRTVGNYCTCHQRASNYCDCFYRSGGKYDPACACHVRSGAGCAHENCSCRSRSTLHDCDCHGRCSCNVVNEYEMRTAKDVLGSSACRCVSRQYGDYCQCHARTVAAQPMNYTGDASTCPSHWDIQQDYCQCVNRTSSVACEYHVVKA